MMLFISCRPRTSVRSHRHHADGVTTPRPERSPDGAGLPKETMVGIFGRSLQVCGIAFSVGCERDGVHHEAQMNPMFQSFFPSAILNPGRASEDLQSWRHRAVKLTVLPEKDPTANLNDLK